MQAGVFFFFFFFWSTKVWEKEQVGAKCWQIGWIRTQEMANGFVFLCQMRFPSHKRFNSIKMPTNHSQDPARCTASFFDIRFTAVHVVCPHSFFLIKNLSNKTSRLFSRMSVWTVSFHTRILWYIPNINQCFSPTITADCHCALLYGLSLYFGLITEALEIVVPREFHAV